ncbi:hypothetical protein KJ762_06770 [bacterium]|nr:hypothetical protein [bacterium]MBU1065873.1 hypothetical protein [bacterium]MBU1634196.1 hypothetical protein [bacterium]MBU1872815.1 hypothetical protein [bacterium]
MNRISRYKNNLVLLAISVVLSLRIFAQQPEIPNPDPLRFAKEINTFTEWN